MSNLEKTHQFLTAYELLQAESFSDSQFDEFELTPAHVIWLETCDSTTEVIKKRLRKGIKEPIICISDKQTAGKGQRDNIWHSPVGNLHMTMYVPIQSHMIHSADAAYIDGRLALETAISLLSMPMLQPAKLNANFKMGVKWPNDLCVLSKGSNQVLSKFSGILIEPVSVKPKQTEEVTLASIPRVCGVIIGIGMNANETQTQAIDGNPISNLQTMLGHTISLPDLAAQVCQACQKSIATFNSHGSSLPVRFFAHDLLYDKTVKVEQFMGTITGVATGIKPDGALTVMENIEKSHSFYDGKVSLCPKNNQ